MVDVIVDWLVVIISFDFDVDEGITNLSDVIDFVMNFHNFTSVAGRNVDIGLVRLDFNELIELLDNLADFDVPF